MTDDSYLDVYSQYLKKFEEMFGEVDFNEIVKYQDKLISKLKYDEFVEKWKEVKTIEDYLKDVMSKGATLNDDVNRSYIELCAVVLQNPKDFMLV